MTARERRMREDMAHAAGLLLGAGEALPRVAMRGGEQAAQIPLPVINQVLDLLQGHLPESEESSAA